MANFIPRNLTQLRDIPAPVEGYTLARNNNTQEWMQTLVLDDVVMDNLPACPRIRRARTDDLIITDEWQSVNYNLGDSGLNVNTFPEYDGVNTVDWDSGETKLTFNSEVQKNYTLLIGYDILGGLSACHIYLRFVIPAPTPIIFPLSESIQRIDLEVLTIGQRIGREYSRPIFADVARDYGLQIQIKSNETLIGLNRPTLKASFVEIYGK